MSPFCLPKGNPEGVTFRDSQGGWAGKTKLDGLCLQSQTVSSPLAQIHDVAFTKLRCSFIGFREASEGPMLASPARIATTSPHMVLDV